MELKRILARDTRSATDKAIALYGPDVLVISNHQVGGQTELVVALDVQPETPPPVAAAAPQEDFRRRFDEAQQQVSVPAALEAQVKAQAQAEAHAKAQAEAIAQAEAQAKAQAEAIAQAEAQAKAQAEAIAQAEAQAKAQAEAIAQAEAQAKAQAEAIAQAEAQAKAQAEAIAQAEAQATAQAQARDLQRSHELVDLVRGEIAALRREFRISQQSSAWQSGLQLHPSLNPLVEALNELNVPAALRALLMDGLRDQSEPRQALAVWRAQLEHSLARPQQAMPTQGVHVLAGPSGSGKTLMCARLARHASAVHGAERLAFISYQDHRAGAWSQVQMLAAQLGMDCFRANDQEALRLLLSELSPRSLVLIDTPGVQMGERLAEIQNVAPHAGLHAVVSADASSAALRRVLVDASVNWQSVMLSKLDESQSPWGLLQLFSDNELLLSCASGGNRMTDLMSTFTLTQLIDLALAPMAALVPDTPTHTAPAKLTASDPVIATAVAAPGLLAAKPKPIEVPATTAKITKPRSRKMAEPEELAPVLRPAVKTKSARAAA